MREARACFRRIFAECLAHRLGTRCELPRFGACLAFGRLCVAEAAPMCRLEVARDFRLPDAILCSP